MIATLAVAAGLAWAAAGLHLTVDGLLDLWNLHRGHR